MVSKKIERLTKEMFEQKDRLIAAIDNLEEHNLNQSVLRNHIRLMEDEVRDMEEGRG